MRSLDADYAFSGPLEPASSASYLALVVKVLSDCCDLGAEAVIANFWDNLNHFDWKQFEKPN